MRALKVRPWSPNILSWCRSPPCIARGWKTSGHVKCEGWCSPVTNYRYVIQLLVEIDDSLLSTAGVWQYLNFRDLNYDILLPLTWVARPKFFYTVKPMLKKTESLHGCHISSNVIIPGFDAVTARFTAAYARSVRPWCQQVAIDDTC